MKVWLKIIIALFIGISFGLLLQHFEEQFPYGAQIIDFSKALGDLFVKLLKMLLSVLLLSSMAVGIADIKDYNALKIISVKTLFLFLLTTLIAIGLGFSVALYFEPGASFLQENLPIALSSTTAIPELTPIHLLLDLVPNSIVEAMAQNNALQVLLFAALLGLAINRSGTQGEPLANILRSTANVMVHLIQMIMKLAPFGIGAMMVWVSGAFGWSVFIALFKVIMAIYAVCFVHMAVVYSFLLWRCGLSPIKFYKQFFEVMVFAFSSSSSAATLPMAMGFMIEKMKVPPNIARFVMPLGATINMNGTAIFHAIVTIFIAQIYGIELHWMQLILVAVVVTLGAVGTAGVPGSAILILGTVLAVVGLPVESIGIIWGIDRIRDMICTVVNVTGDAVVTLYVAHSQGHVFQSSDEPV